MIGGLLVTNQLGRPLEFQCTTPVRPNRTQEILYGPTLQPFVFSELIGRTLLDRADVAPEVVLIRDQRLEEIAQLTRIPVARIVPDAADSASASQLGSCRVTWCSTGSLEQPCVPDAADRISALIPDTANLNEPFDRILEALQESMRVAA